VREWWDSLRDFSSKIIRHWVSATVGVIGGILGVIDAVAAAATAKPKTTPFSIPLWVWLPILAGGFLVAIFRVFHDVRMERDAARAEVKRRFGTLRYALSFEPAIGYEMTIRRPGVCDVRVIFHLKNNSPDEYLRYEFEDTTITIEGKEPAESDAETPNGGVLAPGATVKQVFLPVPDVPPTWETGSFRLTVKYGHPSAPPQYRKSWERELRQAKLAGSPPGQGRQILGQLVSDPEVEDIL
jgi:phosphate/sulfate permease